MEFNWTISIQEYGNTLCWAIYSPIIQSIRSPDKVGTPEMEMGRDSRNFSPYMQLSPAELKDCKELCDWWALQGPGASLVSHRHHVLISDITPDLLPGGFFNCTVEVSGWLLPSLWLTVPFKVLKKREGSRDGLTTVYVTDYTPNKHIYPLMSDWCPPGLFQCIFQVEMWDAAKVLAEEMSLEDYWCLDNVQAKWNWLHYVEDTMQRQQSTHHVDKACPHIQALLACVLWPSCSILADVISSRKHAIASALLPPLYIIHKLLTHPV